jgi:hypothetical protein
MAEGDVCPYTEDGRHHLFGRPWRMPAGAIVQAALRDDPNKPAPLLFWEIDECRRCGHQHATPHGFTPRRHPTVPSSTTP